MSDLHLYELFGPFLSKGDVLGHEPMGIVEAVGAEVTHIRPGDRVVIPFNISCGHCWMCTRGLQSQYGPIKVPHGPPDERFLFLSDVLPTAWQAVAYADVLGLGPVGQMSARIALHRGAEQVFGVDLVGERLEMARRHGVDAIGLEDHDDLAGELRARTGGRGPDSVIDAVGMEAHGSGAARAAQSFVGLLPDAVARKLMETAGVDRLAALLAGIDSNGDFTRDIPLEDDLRLIAVNVTAVVHLAKRALPAMVERGAGRVLITSSVAATMPGPYYATYAASKAFLQSFAQAVRHELKDTGVTVTALQPGPTDTEFFDRAGMQDTKAANADKDDPADVAREGFAAMMAGKDHAVVGSRKNKAQAAAGRVLPETTSAAMHAAQTRPRQGEKPC